MSLPDRLRLPISLDPRPLAREVEDLGEGAWTPHFVAENFDGDWSVAPLRAAAGARHPIQMIHPDPTAQAFVDTPFLAGCPGLRAAIGAIGSPVRNARLMRLGPGSAIHEHRDHELGAEFGTVRLHMPVTTNPEVVFELNRTPAPMAPGEVWYLRLSDPHRVANRGTTPRIHLVLDVEVDGAMRGLLEAAARRGASGLALA